MENKEVNKIDDDIIDLTDKLKKNPITQADLIQDPVLDLRNTVFSYVSKRLSAMEQQEEFKQAIQEKILDKIMNDEKVTVPQLTHLLEVVASQDNLGNESILSLLRSGQGQSAFFEMKDSKNTGELEDLSTDKQQLADKLYRLLQSIPDKEEK